MSHKYKLDFDGQSVVQDDYNGLAEEASTGEDHVYAELFRLTPTDGATVYRGVVPYEAGAIIQPSGASGSVKIYPFRAIVGSRTEAGDDAVANVQDVRSSLSVADGSTSITSTLLLAANASGYTRFDAIYAAVTVDSASTPITRKVKNPGTGVVTDESVSVYTRTAVTVSSVAGTPAPFTPTFPTIPSDAGDVYYILLGYVRVLNGHGASTTVSVYDINDASPVISISSATGLGSCRPANKNNSSIGTSGSGTATLNGVNRWTSAGAQRPSVYLPPSMVGVDSLLVAIDISSATSADWSHQNGDVIDDTRDWRGRVCKWSAAVGAGTGAGNVFPWVSATGNNTGIFASNGSSGTKAYMPGYAASSANMTQVFGIGSTLTSTNAPASTDYCAAISALGAASQATAGTGANVPTNVMVASTMIGFWADPTTGYLKIFISGVPRVSAFFWLDFSGQYHSVS